IKDASMLWWDIRPSAHFPTLEMRVTDVCTCIDDAITIAALYVSTLKMLYKLRAGNQRWRQYAPMLINENRWRAQRYGISEGLIDFGSSETVDYRELVEEWMSLIAESAEELGCSQEIAHALTIIERGTSADRQRDIYQQALSNGSDNQQALFEVVDWLISQTVNV
ncbi:MAG: hypothetical protein OQK12_12760, partial [Motiliproteus sp.]|nr:hypothetical protein [Motiliproteus sp.]